MPLWCFQLKAKKKGLLSGSQVWHTFLVCHFDLDTVSSHYMTAREILAVVAGSLFSIFTRWGPALQAWQPGITQYHPHQQFADTSCGSDYGPQWYIQNTSSSKEKARGLSELRSQRKTHYNPFLMTCLEMHKAEQIRARGRRLVAVVWVGVGEWVWMSKYFP